MPTDDEILALVTDAFSTIERPEHFTNWMHCDECWEHDETLRGIDLATMTVEDVPSESWDPITMCTPHALAYLIPTLARMALAPEHAEWGWYGDRLIHQLAWNGPSNERWRFCTPAQRRAVLALLEHIMNTRGGLVRSYYVCEEYLFQAIDTWSLIDIET
jgi:hypothetical protein